MLVEFLPWLVAMSVLIIASGFFSSSEAALFFLSPQDRDALARGRRAQRATARLLDDPERLLTAILFWNLVVNVTFFAIASIISLHMRRAGQPELAGIFAFVALLTIIFLSEMLPKTVAVLQPRRMASLVGVPLAFAVRAVDPLIPVLKLANDVSRRLFWPGFEPEPYLEVTDLERAVELSKADAALLEQEKTVLQNIVSLSTIRVDELMRPRIQFLSFAPPVSADDLRQRLPRSGYVLVTEGESEEVAGAIPLKSIASLPSGNLERYASEVFYVPWCTTVSHTLEQMREQKRHVAAVVNEFGETIGILTFDDILDTIFTLGASRSARLLNQMPIEPLENFDYRVTGMTTLRRLQRSLDVELPASRCVTVAGILQEVLGRIPEVGDTCQWGPCHMEVLEIPERGQMVLRLSIEGNDEGPRP